MRKLNKKIIAFFLCMVMVCTGPVAAFAETNENGNTIIIDEATETEEVQTNEEEATELTEDTEEVTTEAEEVLEEESEIEAFSVYEQLSNAQSVEEMYILVLDLMQNDIEGLKALTTNEIEDLRKLINVLDPESNNTDTQDLLDTLAALPNGGVQENVEIPELIVGDYDSIIANLESLYEESEKIESYEECIDVYNRLLTVTSAAQSNGEDLLETWQMNVIYSKFYAIRDCLDARFGYTYRTSDALILNNTISTFLSTKTSDTSDVQMNKTVSEVEGSDNEYLLTLEAYVTGESATITKTKPADIVLVLDQSASMYAPMGATGSANNKTIYQPTENVKQYSEEEFVTLSQSDEFWSNAAHLGYYVAQSTAGGFNYCKNKAQSGHKCSDENGCRTYDWFIIQYVPDDADGLCWHFYRVKQTANPSNDSKVTSVVNGELVESREAAIWKRSTLDDVINGSSFVFYKSQYGALYDAISVFGQSVVDQDAGHRVAVATFSAEIEYQKYATGSGIYVDGSYMRYNSNQYYDKDSRQVFTTWQSIYDADTLTAEDYKSALMSDGSSIMASINAVSTDSYGTNHDVGIDIANKIFEQNPVEADERDRIIIMFTDGSPSPVGLSAYTSGYSKDTEGMIDAFIHQAYKAKSEYGAQIYTIWTSTLSSDQSAFMEHGSSDYPDASALNNYGTQISDPKYATGVKTGNQLMDAFGNVFEDVSSTTITELTENTVIKDVVAPSFTLPTEDIGGWDEMTDEQRIEELTSLIKVYQSSYLGNGNFAQKGDTGYTEYTNAEINVSKDENGLYQVDVSNYNFSENYVTDLDSGGYRGNKLVIQIPIEVKPDFLGGDDVITNGEDSGIYAPDGTLVENFTSPIVDVIVSTITPKTNAKSIYLSQTASLPEVFSIGEFKQNNSNYVVDGINNAYVDIIYTITDENGKTLIYTIPAGTDYSSLTDQGWDDEGGLSTHPLLKDDKTYTVTCQIISTNNKDNTSNSSKLETVKVYKPEITFNDSAIDLRESADYSEDNGGSVVWKHGDDEADSETMGDAPTLEYIYTPEESDFTEDTSVKVSVIAKSNGQNVPLDQDITEYVTFYRDACTYEDCLHTEKTEVRATDDDRVNFVVHLKSFDLVINKSVTDGIDENQSFIFKVTGPNDYSIEVMIYGTGSVTIKDLPAGEYTVTEIEDWSWRYEADTSSKTISSGDAVQGTAEVSFANTRNIPNWLSGDCYVENIFASVQSEN